MKAGAFSSLLRIQVSDDETNPCYNIMAGAFPSGRFETSLVLILNIYKIYPSSVLTSYD
jgi:hypothetical protein